ncbi:amidohydrolase [Rhodobacteraceae bacterium NNCM2]|nr:amidohydrolase [Coraliihabitans acroporae]
MTSIEADLDQMQPELAAWRQHLHRNPEFGFEEVETAAFVAEKLHALGITEIAEGVGGTGVVATLRAGASNRAIALRADMDALRIVEATELPYRSGNPGVMHACGHDGHTAMLLGAAAMLSRHGGFDGVIRLIFQPAEEWGRGMQAMLDDGLLDRFPFEEAYGVHNMPGLPIGHFATRPGPFMGAEDNFEIRLSGLGGHASRPHEGQDALVAACATVMGLQTVVSRAVDPSQLAVVSVTELLTDGTRNATAGIARILGDARNFDGEVSRKIEAAMRRIAEGVGAAHGCSVDVTYTREFIPLVNDPELTCEAVAAAGALVSEPSELDANTPPIGASEDFARLLALVPGNYMMIGNGDSAPLHNASYDFNDAAIPFGVSYLVELARRRLPGGG